MAAPLSNAGHPFGSARFAEPKEAARAGLFTRNANALLVGFFAGRPLWYDGMAGAVCIAGARAGKLSTLLGYNLCCGIHPATMVILDIKGGELAAVSRWQVPDRKFCIYWNPLDLHGLKGSRINPVDYIHAGSRTLVSDVKVFAENMIPPSGSPQGRYFEGRAREFLEAAALTLVRLNGVLTLPDLYRVINLMVTGGERWLDFAFEMSESGFDIAERIEEEISEARNDTSGGFKGVLGELTGALSCLSDPVLRESVSPPYDFSLAQLCESGQTYNLYLMPDGNLIEAWAAVIKSFFVGAQVYKSRAPSAPRQTWILDECGQLGSFPLVVKLFTRDAGTGIRPWAFFQSARQMKALHPEGESLILSSAGLQSWFGIRDEPTAATLSRMIGNETLGYIDRHRRAEALHARQQAVQSLLRGGDPFKAGMEMAHHGQVAALPVLTQRPLRTADELLGMQDHEQVIFTDGLSHPLWAARHAYYDQPSMAGRYHPNPHHPPLDRVRVRTAHGYAWRPVIVERVDSRFAHYPQHADGTWSRIG